MELDDSHVDELLGDGTEERTPRDLVEPSTVFNVAFHPTAPVLCLGLVDGRVSVHEFKRNETRPINSIQTHKMGVSSMEFTRNGSHLATVSSDRHIKVMDCTSQQNIIDIKKKASPHKVGLNRLCVCTNTTIAVGDDDGMVSIWDMRSQRVTHKYHEHADQVSGLIYFEGNEHLVTCSGDTTVGCYDVKAGRVLRFSEKRKDELTCMAFLPATNNLICGTDDGMLPIFRYGSWGRPYDIHAKHPRECEAMITYNDNIFFTGAYDGLVRVIQHNPVRRVLCNLGQGHKTYNTVTSISISHDRNLVASCGNDNVVRFHDIEFLGNDEELDKLRGRAERRHLQTIRKAVKEDKFSTSDDSDDEDSSGWSTDSSKRSAGSDAGKAPTTRPFQITDEPLDRATKRDRMAASRWLKTAQKETINFTADTKKKRVKSFWSGLMNTE